MHELVTILILPAVDGEIVDWTEKKKHISFDVRYIIVESTCLTVSFH